VIYESRFPDPLLTPERTGEWRLQAYLDDEYEDLVWTEDYLGQRGRHLWAHRDKYAQVGCFISPDGEMGIALRHAEPVLTWTSPHPDRTEVRVSGRVTGVTPGGSGTYAGIMLNDEWIWNGGWTDFGKTLVWDFPCKVNRDDVLRFHHMVGHGYQIAAGAVDWDLDNRRNDFQEYEGTVRHWAVAVAPVLEESPGDRTYHVDSADGSDENDGLSPERAWKTLPRANAVRFRPGDRILLRAGGTWRGQLHPMGSGTSEKPIRIGVYGEGQKPHIAGEGYVNAAILLYDQADIEIDGLELSNRHPADLRSQRSGILAYGVQGGELGSLTVRNCLVHDVEGYVGSPHRTNSGGSKADQGGIMVYVPAGNPTTRFNGVVIEDCVVRDCVVVAISVSNINVDHMRRGGGLPLTGVVVRRCRVERAGGDAILLIKCDRPLVEHCLVAGANCMAWNNVLGISTAYCDHGVLQYNEVYGMKTRNASQAFGADHGSRNTIVQYNYSHDNEGGFFLSASRGRIPCWSENNIVRYNVSVNDEANVFLITGPGRGNRIYNNTVFVGPHLSTKIVSHYEDVGYPQDSLYANNIIVNHGSGGYDLGKSTGNAFESNLLFGNHPDTEPDDPEKITDDPRLVAPGECTPGRDSLEAYRLRADSPAIGTGRVICGSGGRDCSDADVSSDTPPCRGAFEGKST
jgi:hypothetical protein